MCFVQSMPIQGQAAAETSEEAPGRIVPYKVWFLPQLSSAASLWSRLLPQRVQLALWVLQGEVGVTALPSPHPLWGGLPPVGAHGRSSPCSVPATVLGLSLALE